MTPTTEPKTTQSNVTIITEQQLSNNVTRNASPLTVDDSTTPRSIKVLSLAAALRTELKDVLVLSEDMYSPDLYTSELKSWNNDVVHKPAAIVQPMTTAQVCAAVKAAKMFEARLVIAGGRHGHDCLADDALVIDMSKMKKVDVDADARVVTVEGGCKLGDMDKACKPFGLAAVTGTNPDTGVVGLSTAGGGGYLSRAYGMAVDNFVSAEVVLASGEAVIATKDNKHSDLLWGLAGAGSNFGIVTKLSMKLHPVDKVFGGMAINIAPSKKRCAAVLTSWRDWISAAPRSVMSMAVVPCGAPVVPMAICELDQAAVPQDGAKCTANQLPSLREKLGSGLRRKRFGGLMQLRMLKKMQYHSELQPQLEAVQKGGYYYDAACLVPELSEGVISTLVEFTRVKNVNNEAAIIIFPLGAAISDAPIDSTSFWGGGRKKDAFWIIIEGKWTPSKAAAKGGKDEKREAIVRWVKDLRKALADVSNGGVSETAHTLDGNMESELAGGAAIFGPNYERIKEVKRKYDPENFFQCNRNIKPAEAYSELA